MERRFRQVARTFIVGILVAVAFAAVTGACRENLYARWRHQSGLDDGPPVALSPLCAPSEAAHDYGVEVVMFAWGAGAVALIAGAMALLASVVRRFVGPERTEHARRLIASLNLGASVLLMIALTMVAGCGEGEWQFFALPPLAVGSLASGLGSFVAVPGSRTQGVGQI